eukprot:1927273-Alexandrium_andersonii.AAC.1
MVTRLRPPAGSGAPAAPLAFCTATRRPEWRCAWKRAQRRAWLQYSATSSRKRSPRTRPAA